MTRRPAAVVLVALVALTGCQAPTPSEPPPTRTTAAAAPSPTPSPSCTPEAGGASYPCTPAQYAAMKQKDALYAEAEAVYREFHAESVRLSRVGGAATATDLLKKLTTGSALKGITEVFASMHRRGVHAEGVDPEIRISRLPGRSKAGSIVALTICTDSTGWRYLKGDEQVGVGRIANEDVYFSRASGALKLIGVDGREAATCA